MTAKCGPKNNELMGLNHLTVLTFSLSFKFDINKPIILNHLIQIGMVKKLDKCIRQELNETNVKNLVLC